MLVFNLCLSCSPSFGCGQGLLRLPCEGFLVVEVVDAEPLSQVPEHQRAVLLDLEVGWHVFSETIEHSPSVSIKINNLIHCNCSYVGKVNKSPEFNI